MGRKIKYVTINVPEETRDKIKFICDRANLKISAFLKELIDEFFESSSMFERIAIIYTGESGKLIVNFIGKSNMITGTFSAKTMTPDSEIDKIVQQKIGEELKARNEENE